MAFGEHLRTDQDIRFALLGCGQRGNDCFALLGRVAVDPADTGSRETISQGFLDTLGAHAEWPHRGTAFAAMCWQGARSTTMMAAQRLVGPVYGHARVAAQAAGDVTAIGTDQGRSKATPVQENQCLVAVFQLGLDGSR